MDAIVFPHLNMTEDAFEGIMAEVCQADTVLAKHEQRIIELDANIENYQKREQEHFTEVNKIEAQEDELRAKMRELDTMKREAHGKIASMKYHQSLAVKRIKQTKASIEKRKKFLFHDEARKRLAVLGRELKLGVGGYRAGRGLGTEVREIKRPTDGQPIKPQIREDQITS